MSEQLIYQLPDIDHPNILHYIGVEQHGENLQAEFWLITAFHEKGSLCDWLKANIVSWPELCRIAETMARSVGDRAMLITFSHLRLDHFFTTASHFIFFLLLFQRAYAFTRRNAP